MAVSFSWNQEDYACLRVGRIFGVLTEASLFIERSQIFSTRYTKELQTLIKYDTFAAIFWIPHMLSIAPVLEEFLSALSNIDSLWFGSKIMTCTGVTFLTKMLNKQTVKSTSFE